MDAHQPGIATRQQGHLALAAFDVTSERVPDLRELLVVWSQAAQRLMAGRRSARDVDEGAVLDEPGETAQVRLAGPPDDAGPRMLRRSYNYFDGVDPASGELDAGLVLLCFQRDPRRQWVPVQQRLAERDALARYGLHTGSAVFAIPPAWSAGGFVADGLFG